MYCHLQCWHGTDGPNSRCRLTEGPSLHQLNKHLHALFDVLWQSWTKDQLQALTRSPAENVAAGALSEAVHSTDEETPKGRKNGIFDCRTTRNRVHGKSDWRIQQEWGRGEASGGVVAVDTPPRKRAREEHSTHGHRSVWSRAAAQVCESKELQQMEVVMDTDEEEGEDQDEERGGVLTQPGIPMM